MKHIPFWLVVWLPFFEFSHINWESSSHLTNSYFSEGWPWPTNQPCSCGTSKPVRSMECLRLRLLNTGRNLWSRRHRVVLAQGGRFPKVIGVPPSHHPNFRWWWFSLKQKPSSRGGSFFHFFGKLHVVEKLVVDSGPQALP